MLLNHLFYTFKLMIPRRVQIALRRHLAAHKRRKYADTWPIDPNSATPPQGWTGWPGGKKFALVLCHDGDTIRGCNNVLKLAELEESMGFRSCFSFVPEPRLRRGCLRPQARRKALCLREEQKIRRLENQKGPVDPACLATAH
jgi:hypothetical protein